MSSGSVARDRWQPVWGEVMLAAAVIAALAVLAAVALWGMKPAPATSTRATPAVTAPAVRHEPEGNDGG